MKYPNSTFQNSRNLWLKAHKLGEEIKLGEPLQGGVRSRRGKSGKGKSKSLRKSRRH